MTGVLTKEDEILPLKDICEFDGGGCYHASLYTNGKMSLEELEKNVCTDVKGNGSGDYCSAYKKIPSELKQNKLRQ